MDNKKTFLVAAFASIAIAAFATPGGPGTASRRSAFSSPNDPFHDTYKKNTGQIRREAPKPVNNLHSSSSWSASARVRAQSAAGRTSERSPL